MKLSHSIFRTSKTPPADEPTANARLLEQAGFVNKLMAGAYTYLPLGLKVLNNISQIVREEMDKIGGQELLMPMLHPKQNWVTTGGWDSIDVLFHLKSRHEHEYALGQSEEEVVTPLVQRYLGSYKDLPAAPYQIHWKFRDELRAKSGVMRGREFLMKDMYSFHENEADFLKFYETAKAAYLKIYERMGLTAKATEASGGSFSKKISYEFIVLTDAGEDNVLYTEQQPFCINEEIAEGRGLKEGSEYNGETLKRAKGSEVGNVFDLGTKYSEDFGFSVTMKDGSMVKPHMGCYGIGITRLMGVIVEKFHDEKGIIWPAAVAPALLHLVALKGAEAEADKLYEQLTSAGVEVLYDDRDLAPGAKFADADLIGLPWRAVVSPRTLEKNSVELKPRSGTEADLVPTAELITRLAGH